jgi:FdhD protein
MSRDKTQRYEVVTFEDGTRADDSCELIEEEPLLIRIEDKPYSVVMRTPGEEEAQATGFCLAEGLIDSPDDLYRIGYDRPLAPNVIDVWLRPQRKEDVHVLLKRKGFISQTSCGICGKVMVEDLQQILEPVETGFELTVDRAFACLDKLSKSQRFYERTRGSHASLLFDERLEVISFAEDVGRHNALDKAIGKAFLARTLPAARVGVLSSRISYELVQKAARARIPVVIGNSRPTALAAQMGLDLNLTLLFPDGQRRLVAVCSEERIKND